MFQDYQFTIEYRPGCKHNNADSLSWLPCQQCGRNSHNSETVVTGILVTGLTGGYSAHDMRDLQLKDDSIGQLLLARDAPIIGSVTISADDMLIFTISGIGTACTGSRYKYRL